MNLPPQKPFSRSIVRPLSMNDLPSTYSRKAPDEVEQRTGLGRKSGRQVWLNEPSNAGVLAPSRRGSASSAAVQFEAQHVVSLSVRIATPTSTTYEKWGQFTSLPDFMRAPGRFETEESRMVWRVRAWNDSAPWLATTTEVEPGYCIAWAGSPGPLQAHRGKVVFESMDSEGAETRVTVTLELGQIHAGGVWLDAMATLVEAALASFSRSIHSPASTAPLPA